MNSHTTFFHASLNDEYITRFKIVKRIPKVFRDTEAFNEINTITYTGRFM